MAPDSLAAADKGASQGPLMKQRLVKKIQESLLTRWPNISNLGPHPSPPLPSPLPLSFYIFSIFSFPFSFLFATLFPFILRNISIRLHITHHIHARILHAIYISSRIRISFKHFLPFSAYLSSRDLISQNPCMLIFYLHSAVIRTLVSFR